MFLVFFPDRVPHVIDEKVEFLVQLASGVVNVDPDELKVQMRVRLGPHDRLIPNFLPETTFKVIEILYDHIVQLRKVVVSVHNILSIEFAQIFVEIRSNVLEIIHTVLMPGNLIQI